MSRPGHLERVVAKLLANALLVRVTFASGRCVDFDRDTYSKLPAAWLVGARVEFVEKTTGGA